MDFRFPGRGQRNTPVTDVRGIVEIVMLLPGQQAACVRRQAAELLVRYLGGDMRIIDEVRALRAFKRSCQKEDWKISRFPRVFLLHLNPALSS